MYCFLRNTTSLSSLSRGTSMSGRDLKRRYGFFRCDDCGKLWESSHVYILKHTGEVMEIIPVVITIRIDFQLSFVLLYSRAACGVMARTSVVPPLNQLSRKPLSQLTPNVVQKRISIAAVSENLSLPSWKINGFIFTTFVSSLTWPMVVNTSMTLSLKIHIFALNLHCIYLQS